MPADAAAGIDALRAALASWGLLAGLSLVPMLLLFLIPRPAWLRGVHDALEQGPRFFHEVGFVVLMAFALEGALVHAVAAGVDGLEASSEQLRSVLLVKFILCPVTIAIAILVPRLISGTRAGQLGLSILRFRANACIGYATWLVITPPILCLFWLILLSVEREMHPVEILLAGDGRVGTWLLVLGVVLLAAPVVEELVHRGVIQPWLMRHPTLAHLVVAITFLSVLGHVTQELWEAGAWSSGWLLVELAALGPGYLVLVLLIRRRPALAWLGGLVASSAVFAALHVWPTPIPLFVLGLVLGWLRYRTGSLVAPITAHMLFNVVGLLPVLFRQMEVW